MTLVLKKIGFDRNAILWIKIILKNQEPCVIGGEITTKYFKLNRGPCQGDPISAFFIHFGAWNYISSYQRESLYKWVNNFWLLLLIFCICWRHNLFSERVSSIREMLNSFHIFCRSLGLRPHLSKWEIASINVLSVPGHWLWVQLLLQSH